MRFRHLPWNPQQSLFSFNLNLEMKALFLRLPSEYVNLGSSGFNQQHPHWSGR